MTDLADVVRLFGPSYHQHYGERMLPSHRRALRDITACRTEAFGGHMAQCDQCGHQHYSYHSCRNRSCPKCHTNDSIRWLGKRHAELLPTSYFHVVFTLPEELRSMVRRHQKQLYSALFKAAAQALLTLCRDPRYVGGEVGVLGVLHTWTRQLQHHPHIHFLVTGGVCPQMENGWLHVRSIWFRSWHSLFCSDPNSWLLHARSALMNSFPTLSGISLGLFTANRSARGVKSLSITWVVTSIGSL